MSIRAAQPIKGRGAISNIQGRFELQLREGFDDGWASSEDHRDDVSFRAETSFNTETSFKTETLFKTEPSFKTEIREEFARSILTRNKSPDVPFSVSLNPYRGCEHGCIYCFARPTHSYLELSPGLDFETRLFAKVNAADLLRRELASRSYHPEPIALGVNTDAYQPCERKYGITRKVLEVLHECEHPVGLITKSSLIERDIDLLSDMAKRQLASVTITVTTLDHDISRTLEPRATSPTRRLQTVRRLAEAGIPVSVNIAPVIPFITDHDMESILEAAFEAGASSANYIVLRLPWEVNPLFREWLEAHFPARAARVMHRIQDLRGGKDYNPEFGVRMRGEGVWADLLHQRFTTALRKLRLGKREATYAALDSSRFRRPRYVPSAATVLATDSSRQLDMF